MSPPSHSAVFAIHDTLLENIIYSIYSLHTRPVVAMKFNDVLFENCLYDCGSQCTLINKKTLATIRRKCQFPLTEIPLNVRASAANRSTMKISQCFRFKCEFEGSTTYENILICEDLHEHCIVGIPLIRKLKMAYCPLSNMVSNKSASRYTIRNKMKTAIQPYEVAYVKVSIMNDFDESCSSNTVVGQIKPIDCPTLTPCNELLETGPRGLSTVCIFNSGHQAVCIPKNHILGEAEVIDPLKIRKFDEVMSQAVVTSVSTITTKIKNNIKKPTPITEEDKLWIRQNINLSHLSTTVQEMFYGVLEEFHHVFSRHKFDIGKLKNFSHTIELISDEKKFSRQFSTPWSQETPIRECVKNWLLAQIIYPMGNQDNGEMNSAIFAVPKKLDLQDQKDQTISYRICLDYRFLNSVSKCPNFKMPSLEDCFDVISKNRPSSFISLDITSAFQHLPLKDDKEMQSLTAFTFEGVRYAFERAPFGIHAIPGQWQKVMNTILQPLISKGSVLPYQDDVLLMGKNPAELVDALRKCLQIFSEAGLKANPRKFLCCVPSLKYLGFEISEHGLTISKDNINSIKYALPPTTLYEIRAFMGLANFFRSLCPDFSKMTAALVACTRKNTRWRPGRRLPPLALKSFNNIKSFLISRPSIGWPNRDSSLKFHLYADASMHELDTLQSSQYSAKPKSLKEGSLAYVLCQENQRGLVLPISYGSRNLRGAERSYSSFLLELKACEFAIDQCSHYLHPPRRFTLYSDCRPLVNITKKSEIRTMNRLQFLMSKYIFDIQYIKGSNMIADWGSRYGHSTKVHGVNMFQSFLPEVELAKFQKLDPLCKCLFHFVQTKGLPDNPVFRAMTKRLGPQCIVTDSGVLMIKSKANGKFLFFAPSCMAAEIIAAGHCIDHRATQSTVDRIMQVYYIVNAHREVDDFIKCCTTCQRVAKAPANPRAPMKSVLRPAENVFDRIFIDLYGPLPEKNEYKYILVVVDGFSRFTRYIALCDKKPQSVAQALFDKYVAIFGIPSLIMSDFGSEFESKLSHAFYALFNIDKRHSSAFRPASDGAAEAKMKQVTHLLRCFLLENSTDDWPSMLGLLEFATNSAVSRAHGQTPYFLLFNKHPNTGILSGEAPLRHFYGSDYPSILGNRINKVRDLAKKCNLNYIDKYKEAYDKKVKSFDIQPNSLVWLYTPGHRKLDLLYSGPYVVLRKISTYNYLIQNIHSFATKLVSIHRLKPYYMNPLISTKQLAAQASSSDKPAAASLDNNDDLDHDSAQSNKGTDLRHVSDDIVLLSDAHAVAAHQPLVLKNETGLDVHIKTEPSSPTDPHSATGGLADQSIIFDSATQYIPTTTTHVSPSGPHQSQVDTRSKTTFSRLGSKIFGGSSSPGYVPDTTDIVDYLGSRITRHRAAAEKIDIPPIWPIPKEDEKK